MITVDYGYDHNKQRISYDNGTFTTYYPNKYFNQSTATTTRHIFAGNQLVATIEGTGTATSTNYIHTDHLGGTHIVTDESGNKVQLLDYYPFGGLRLNETDALDEQRKFIGQYYDEDTALSYLNARYYDGARGQFTSQDPSFLDIGKPGFEARYGRTLEQHLANPQALNSYSYALNNPITLSDPEGEIVPLLIAAYAAVEIGLSAYDAYTTAETLSNPNASFGEKTTSVLLFGLGVAGPGAGYAQAPKLVDKATDAARAVNKLPDSTLVCRGGTCNAKNFAKPGEVKNGVLSGSSVNASPNASIEDLTKSFPQNRFGQTTLDRIRALGGDVIPSNQTSKNPYHADLNGITPRQAESLFKPTNLNPNKSKK